MENKNLSLIVRIVAGVMLVLAMASWPYGYYQLLRLVICGASIFLIWYFYSIDKRSVGWLFIIPAVLFNPLIPLYFARETWIPLDVAAACLFFGSILADVDDKK